MAFVQGRTVDDSAVATVALAYNGAVTPGNMLWCEVSCADNQTISGVSDSVNGAWSSAINVNNTPNNQRTALFYQENTGAGTPTVTATFSAEANFVHLTIMEESGVATTTPLDKVTSAIGTSNSASSGNVTPATDGQTLAGGMQAFGVTITATGGWTRRITDVSQECVSFDQVQVTAAAVALTASLSGSTNWLAAIATFTAAAGGGGDTLMGQACL